MAANINQTVLMSGVDYFDTSEALNPFMTAGAAVNRAALAAEHAAIAAALQSAGIELRQVAPPPNCQDGVYTANWGLVRGSKAVLARLPAARSAEIPYAEQVLHDYGIGVTHLPGNLKFSGQGDALPCGNYLFCGSAYRSDAAAQAFVADTLGYERIQLQTVPLTDQYDQPVTNKFSGWPDSFFYDIDLALSILKFPSDNEKGLIAWCPEAFVPESQQLLRDFDNVDKIEVSKAEATTAFACNLVSTGEVVVMNDGAPIFARAIESHGLKTIRLQNPELAKGGGSIRCTTLTLDN